MNNNEQKTQAYDLPAFTRSKKVIAVAIAVALVSLIATLSMISPMLLIGPIEANDEEAALTALILTLGICLGISAVLTVLSVVIFRKKELISYQNKMRELIHKRHEQEQEEQRKKQEQEKQKALRQERERKEKVQREARTVCEFCGERLSVSDHKGISYNSSYTQSVTASISGDKLNLTANKVGYGVTQGEEHYTCHKCHYSVIAHYEILSGSWGESKTYKVVNIDASPIEFYMQVRNGRLSRSFPIKK